MWKVIIACIKKFFNGGVWDHNSSKCYCICGHEILQDPRSQVYDAGSHYNIICSNCNAQTSWNLDAPVPLFIDSKTIK